MKTKAALLWDFDQPWQIEDVEIGDARRDEVRIQMEAAGMCHTDHHLVTGGIPMAGFPVLGGHEGAGVVVEVGPGVDHLEPGDHAVLSFIPSCGSCPSCQAGLRNLCDLGAGLVSGQSVSDGTFRITARGRNVYPMTLLGTFSPFAVVNRSGFDAASFCEKDAFANLLTNGCRGASLYGCLFPDRTHRKP